MSARISKLILHPASAAIATILCVSFLYLLERKAANMPFVVLSTLAIAAVLFIPTRRAYFSIYAAFSITVLLSILSVFKYRNKGFDLHIYDVVFTGMDSSAFLFLITEFTGMAVLFLGLLLCGLVVLGFIFAKDGISRIGAGWRIGIMAVTLAVIPVSYPLKAGEPRYFHYLGGFNASSFFISFLDLSDVAMGRGTSGRLSGLPKAEPFAAPGVCETAGPKPDIFVVLSESQTDLGRIDQFGIDQQFAPYFISGDGKRRSLNVETFGGGTWISNFSLMTGLSSLDFGWQAPYLTTTMEGKVSSSLATELSRCGYKTAVLMPMEYQFVNEGPFLESIGFDEILDYNRIGASKYAHPDRFYYQAARDFIAKHRATDGRPLFLQVQTMFSHSPYSTRLSAAESDMTVETGDPELNEYLRRVVQAKRDLNWFLEQTDAESQTNPAIVLEFGDHQSVATRQVITRKDASFAINDLESPAYQTFFTVNAFGTPLNMRPFDFERLDVGYLGVSLLESAGLLNSPMFADLAALRDRCGGRLYSCPDRAAVDKHLARRIASGLLVVD